ncbi:hypothetical protein SERLA73DRAFT_154027 [Serpula lacrymans var. lacrymans S7.3]|uniref:CCHC-type domain-containing protein n=1 Tax=Serpula lacrymans var. lacrymans (strain S7.3) TaxID=936435 RepID=F8Q3G7_SERL3|nr:hypothetical protein SERLA73DRAFT_154027 [Serpula lacrymans var. lacrymans S7.3]
MEGDQIDRVHGTFITADVKATASVVFMMMKMETGETAVKFNSYFMVEAGKSGLNNEGLIMNILNSTQPKNIAGWISTVAGLDANWMNSNSISKGKWGKKGEKKKEEKGGRSQLSLAKQLTKDEEDSLKREGQCFICKEQGHMSQFCPEKKKRKQLDQRIRMAEAVEKDEIETVVEDRKGILISHILKMWRELNKADRASTIDELEKEGFYKDDPHQCWYCPKELL